MPQDLPGIAFEKVVAAIQRQIDPTSTITHSEFITDRLGNRRQFDVAIRGSFAGQEMLGVIECKDLSGKVGTPEIDAFATKSQNINANFKIVMSRNGFTKPALKECAHYGIQPLSLLENDPANKKFFVGTRWEAEVTRWGQISTTLIFVNEPKEPVHFNAEEVNIDGKPVLDWFKNYLLDKQDDVKGLGWVVNISAVFDKPQIVSVNQRDKYLCKAISFAAERVCDKLERLVGISGTGFFNWSSNRATFPPNNEIRSDAVPLDFSQWSPRSSAIRPPSGFIDIRIEAHQVQFARVADAIPLELL